MDKQKTTEDYRNIIKLLKLKVLKLQKKNQELEQKLYEPLDESVISQEVEDDQKRPQSKYDPASQTEGVLLQDLYKGCRKIGITTEGVFRAADTERSQTISTEQLKLFLKNCKLQLSPGQVNRLVALADENCSGQVTEQNWHKLLDMYEVSQEKRNTNERTFAQQSMFKIANIFIQKKISPEEAFGKVASNHTTITSERLKSYAMNADPTINEQECSSAFNHLDFNKKGRVIKEHFVGEVRKVMRILAENKGISISQYCPPKDKPIERIEQQYQEPPRQSLRPQQPSFQSPKKSPLDASMTKSRLQQSYVNEVIPHFDISEVETQKVIASLNGAGVDIRKLYQHLLDNLINPLAGIRIKDVYTAFDSLEQESRKKYPNQVKLDFFKCLDQNQNGGADFNEALAFYCSYMSSQNDKVQQDSIEILFGMKNQHLKATQTTVDEYLEQFQIDDSTNLNYKSFRFQAKKMFNQDPEDENLSFMTKVAKAVEERPGKLKNKLKTAKISSKAEKKVKIRKSENIQLDKFEQELETVRQETGKTLELEDSDYFHKERLDEGSGEVIKEKWNTIFNDEISCLIKCLEIVKDLKEKNVAKWTDPDFGPNERDKVSAQSLYFTDNDIPNGAPKPEEVLWLRPEEILQTLIDMGATYKTGNKDPEDPECDEEKDYEGKIPIFLEGGASSNDVQQSQYLGNCWFISALSIIATDDDNIDGDFELAQKNINNIQGEEARGMVTGVYPPMFHFLEPFGIYVMKFFKNAGWRFVIIDDRIPCKEGGEIIYGQCQQKNELWVPMIEKAYAKIHQCYQALIAGDIAQGLADMTGLIADKSKLSFKNLKVKSEEDMNEEEKAEYKVAREKEAKEADELWEKLKSAKDSGTLMGCSAEGETEGFIDIDGENSGIMSGHAYSLLDVIELDQLEGTKDKKRQFHRLLRIRNPWGHGEWKFKWSDSGSEYAEQTKKYQSIIDEYYKKELKLWNQKHPENQRDASEFESIQLGVDDGTFLMNFREWRQLFANLFQCIDFPDEWSGKRIKGNWTKECCAGPPKKGKFDVYANENPQYTFTLNRRDSKKNTTQVYINLTQRDGRMFWGEKYPYAEVTTYMLLCVYKLDNGETELKEYNGGKLKKGGSSKSLILRREVDSDFMDLPNGTYAIIPTVKQAGYEGEFALNIYFDCPETDIKFNGTYGKEVKVEEIAEEQEKAQTISKNKQWVFTELAKREMQWIKQKEDMFNKQKKKKLK